MKHYPSGLYNIRVHNGNIVGNTTYDNNTNTYNYKVFDYGIQGFFFIICTSTMFPFMA